MNPGDFDNRLPSLSIIAIAIFPFRYYDQLCSMETKLPIMEDQVCIKFLIARIQFLLTNGLVLSLLYPFCNGFIFILLIYLVK